MVTGTTNRNSNYIEIEQILEMIPHRYPFLMIDRVIEIIPDKSAIGIKNVTINEPYFNGHFPNKPIMPGVLIIEAMAQTAAVFVIDGLKDGADNLAVYFMSIDSARFRKPVTPGDMMKLKILKRQSRGNVWKFDGEAYVEENLVAESTFSAMIANQ